MKLYVHSQKDLQLIEVADSTTVAELVKEHGEEDAAVWLEDADEALDLESKIADSGIRERGHIHVSKCRKIAVTVRYAGETKSRSFAPSATIARVFKWATGNNGFDLTPTERAKHTLGICDTLDQPDKSDHVGTFAGHNCAVCFDLAPKERFEG